MKARSSRGASTAPLADPGAVHVHHRPSRLTLLAAACVTGAAGLAAGLAAAQEPRSDGLAQVGQPTRVVVNDSFISPLVERFGDVRVGRGVFVAGNAVLRADLRRRVCLGHRTNVQDNVLVLSVDRPRAVARARAAALRRARAARTSLAHQAEVVNCRGRRLHVHRVPRRALADAVISDGAFVSTA